jgi:Sec-independent protein translocase protein TatA
MEFLNIGGGELIVIVLLAIILFGPEDILKIMRTVGGYVQKLQQMWAQVSSGLQGEFDDNLIPEDLKETIKETRESVTEVQKTLEEVTAVAKADLNETITAVSEIQTSVETDIKDTKATVEEIKAALEADIEETKTTVSEIETSLVDVQSSIETSIGEIPKAIEAINTTSPTQTAPTSPKEEEVLLNAAPSDQQVQPSTDAVPSAIALPDADGEKAQAAETTIASEDM